MEDCVWIHDHETEEFENMNLTLEDFANKLIESINS